MSDVERLGVRTTKVKHSSVTSKNSNLKVEGEKNV
jgi:hypothetical protein